MRKLGSFIALPFLSLALSGCLSHSIREGIWELSFTAQDVKTRQPVDIIPRARVDVTVDWGKEGGEVAEIKLIAKLEDSEWKPARGLAPPFYAEIPPGSDALQAKGQDNDWFFILHGKVVSDERVSGTQFFARHTFVDDLSLEGRWEMVWKGPRR
jgi:hypothetical protein